MTSSPSFRVETNESPTPAERREEILAAPGFGLHFSDHMVVVEWTPQEDWHDHRVQPYAPFSVDPASAVLHYAQEIFEGLKAYRHSDGSIWTFRPEANAQRMLRSARRLALPQLPPETFVAAVDALVSQDQAWIPGGGEASLYVRPFMFASEVFLGVRASQHVTFAVIASPAGAYFSRGVRPVSIWLSTDYSRAGAGGTGAAKCGGNYAASLIAQQEAAGQGCDQVAFLDSEEHTWVEELGGMNLCFVYDDGTIVTPESESILSGITRDSILCIADQLGHKIDQRRVSIDEWRDGVSSGAIREVFACGTAAVLTPVGELKWDGGHAGAGGDEGGPVTLAIRARLLDVQYGRAADSFGWMHRVA